MTEPWGKPLDELGPEELEALIRRHDFLYWEKNTPEISDYDYDRLVRRLQRVRPESPLLARVGGGGEAARERLGAKVEHTSPMLSLDKCYGEDQLMEWAAGVEGELVGSPKVDGMAVSLRYDAEGNLALATTRGDGLKGDDVTANLREVPAIPRHLPEGNLEVRGEVYTPLAHFKPLEAEFANPRNFTAGTVKQKEGSRDHLKLLAFAAYDLLGRPLANERDKRELLVKLGFSPVWGEVLPRERERLAEFYARVLGRRDQLEYEVDGVVFKAELASEHQRLGATAHHPRYAIAYKFQGESGVTTLQRVEWSVARTGVITPVAIIAPVRLSGAMVTRCSLHNVSILRTLDLHLGDQVVAMRRGGVIPNLEASLGGGTQPVTLPADCPSCGKPTQEREGFLYCPEPDSCRGSSLKRLEHFAAALDLEGFGSKLVAALFEAGLLVTPGDLFRLRVEDLLPLERMGETLARKLVARVDQRRRIPLGQLLSALGIREVGRQVAGTLEKHFGTLERLRAASEAEIGELFGVGPVIAACVVAGLGESSALLDDLLTQVTLINEEPRAGALAGRKVVFTGKLAHLGRKQAQELVRAAGGETPDQVTRDLDLLVVGDEGSPLFGQGAKGSKQVLAERYVAEGATLRVISEAEFLKLVKGSDGVPAGPLQGALL
jgi:DNA ligase (NAD+)